MAIDELQIGWMPSYRCWHQNENIILLLVRQFILLFYLIRFKGKIKFITSAVFYGNCVRTCLNVVLKITRLFWRKIIWSIAWIIYIHVSGFQISWKPLHIDWFRLTWLSVEVWWSWNGPLFLSLWICILKRSW
jgi:hypothetical protein